MTVKVEDRVFTYPIGTTKLDIRIIDGVTWVPFMGNVCTPEVVERRKKVGGFSGLLLEVGWHVVYRPIDCVSVKAMGYMSTYCK